MRILSLICLLSSSFGFLQSPAHAADPIWDGKIIEVHTGKILSAADLASQLAALEPANIVLGEKHYTDAVQNAEAQLILATEKRSPNAAAVKPVVAWEFLEVSSDAMIQDLFEKFVSGAIDGPAWVQGVFQRNDELTYLPLIQASKDLGAQLLSVNLSHDQKDPVVQGGLKAIDPSLIPQGFAMGGKGYYDRFTQAMQGHSTADEMENYFEAQCLTDDVIAYHLLGDSRSDRRYLIVGQFHTDYNDGVIARIQARAPSQKTVTIRITDASDFAPTDLQGDSLQSFLQDPTYGDIADYVYFVNEPQAQQPSQ